MSDSRVSDGAAAIVCLADVATMYILDCQLDDVVPPDGPFMECLQSFDKYWESGDAFSVALLDSESQIQDSIDSSVRQQVMDAVPRHHQYVVDDFVPRFKSQLAPIATEDPAWDAFVLYTACMLRFIDRFLARTKQIGAPCADRLNSTGSAFCRIVKSVVSDCEKPVNHGSVRATLASLECDQLWDAYVSTGIRRFQTESKNAR